MHLMCVKLLIECLYNPPQELAICHIFIPKWPPVARGWRGNAGGPSGCSTSPAAAAIPDPAGAFRRARGAGRPRRGVRRQPARRRVRDRPRGARGADVRFFRWDALNDPPPDRDGYDVVTCSLFLHHLDDDDAVALLRTLAATAGACCWWTTWSGPPRLCAGLGRLPAVEPLARRPPRRPGLGRRGVPARGAVALAARAGLAGATLTRHWPQRFLLTWRPS